MCVTSQIVIDFSQFIFNFALCQLNPNYLPPFRLLTLSHDEFVA